MIHLFNNSCAAAQIIKNAAAGACRMACGGMKHSPYGWKMLT